MFMKKVSYYSMDVRALEKMLKEEDAIDWSTKFYIGGEFRLSTAGNKCFKVHPVC